MPVFPTTSFIQSTLDLIKEDTPHLALYTSAPNASGGGTELSGGSYVRRPITFSSVSNGSIANTVAMTYSNLPTAQVTHYAILDAETGGEMKVFGALNATAAIVSGDQIQFPVNSVIINLAGS